LAWGKIAGPRKSGSTGRGPVTQKRYSLWRKTRANPKEETDAAKGGGGFIKSSNMGGKTNKKGIGDLVGMERCGYVWWTAQKKKKKKNTVS